MHGGVPSYWAAGCLISPTVSNPFVSKDPSLYEDLAKGVPDLEARNDCEAYAYVHCSRGKCARADLDARVWLGPTSRV